MEKAVGYLRVSTDGQATEDKFGIKSQKEEIREWASANGYEITDWYADKGYSGSVQSRPALQSMLDDVKLSEKPVIVAKMDRFARSTYLHLFLEKELIKANSSLLSVAEDSLNEDNPANQLLREIMMAFAKFESQRISERMASGRKQKAKKGGLSSGRIPFGYKKDENGEIVVDPTEADTVRMIYRDRHENNYTLREIADYLNSLKIKTKSGNKWSAKSVSYILNNDKYKGILKQHVQGEQIESENGELAIVN